MDLNQSELLAADINEDGIVNISDVVALTNTLLNN